MTHRHDRIEIAVAVTGGESDAGGGVGLLGPTR
jgi:hypothetical protein